MPPANTPRQATSRSQATTPERSLTPLSYLSSPVPDLASTLFTQAQSDATDENVRFLRIPVESAEEAQQAPGITSAPAPNQLDSRHQQYQRQYERLQRWRTRQQSQPDPRERTATPVPANQDVALGAAAASTVAAVTSAGEAVPTGQAVHDIMEQMIEAQAEGRELRRQVRLREEAHRNNASSSNPANGSRPGISSAAVGRRTADADSGRSVTDLQREYAYLYPDQLAQMSRMQLEHEATLERALEQRRMRSALQTDLEADRRHRLSDNLRSTAILQHARSSNNPDTASRQTQERQTTHDGQSLSTVTRWARAGADSSALNMTREALYGRSEADRRMSEWRREYLSEQPNRDAKSGSPTVSPLLTNAIQYLDQIRDCPTFQDALDAAVLHSFATKEFFADKADDFIMDVDRCRPPAPSSWLQPGMTFDGSQHTTHVAVIEADQRHGLRGGDQTRPFDATRPWLSHVPSSRITSSGQAPVEQWPVKVTIHSVNPETMTLTGVMEAYDVPNTCCAPHDSTFSGRKGQPITTYLEGQILDLQTHGFLTPQTKKTKDNQTSARPARPASINFPETNPTIDASNWRRLPPFKSIKDDEEVARMMLSHDCMATINREYIFMRWKERCFIHSSDDGCAYSPRQRQQSSDQNHQPRQHNNSSNPDSDSTSSRARHAPWSVSLVRTQTGEGDDTDTGHGLTISGFYYVSLRRSDGAVEGLYFDPSTSPYQCLRLKAKNGGLVGAWGFR